MLLTGADATEGALKTLAAPPRVLHLATHGYYLEAGSIDGQPLLQSGITLAGANRALEGKVGPDGENGVLHAVEAQTLNLYGTELVVLSACDTGKGAVDYSEGLEGLPRALYVAGAKNVLVALWPIGDLAARNFMERFYETWLAQPISDPALALRQTKLAFINSDNPAERDPAAWAPFVLFEERDPAWASAGAWRGQSSVRPLDDVLLLAPRATMRSTPLSSGRCSALASAQGAVSQVTHSDASVRIAGIAWGWIAPTSAFASVVRNP